MNPTYIPGDQIPKGRLEETIWRESTYVSSTGHLSTNCGMLVGTIPRFVQRMGRANRLQVLLKSHFKIEIAEGVPLTRPFLPRCLLSITM